MAIVSDKRRGDSSGSVFEELFGSISLKVFKKGDEGGDEVVLLPIKDAASEIEKSFFGQVD